MTNRSIGPKNVCTSAGVQVGRYTRGRRGWLRDRRWAARAAAAPRRSCGLRLLLARLLALFAERRAVLRSCLERLSLRRRVRLARVVARFLLLGLLRLLLLLLRLLRA